MAEDQKPKDLQENNNLNVITSCSFSKKQSMALLQACIISLSGEHDEGAESKGRNTGQRLAFPNNNDVTLPAHLLAGKSGDDSIWWHGEFGDRSERKAAAVS